MNEDDEHRAGLQVVEHPLCEMLKLYCGQYNALREEHLDLQNLEFHRRYGLYLHVPASWPVLESMNYIVRNSRISKTVVIFSSATSYRKVFDLLENDVKYCSWHEIFTAMQLASTDIRHVQRVKTMLNDAELIIFVDPPTSLTDLLDQVRNYATGCLVILDKGSE